MPGAPTGRGLRCPLNPRTGTKSRLLCLSRPCEVGEGVAGIFALRPGSTVSIVTAREAGKAALFRPTTRPQARLTNGPAGYLRDGVIDNGWGVGGARTASIQSSLRPTGPDQSEGVTRFNVPTHHAPRCLEPRRAWANERGVERATLISESRTACMKAHL